MQLTVPIKVELPENWADTIAEKLKPSGDYVPVVRCRNCRWFNEIGCAIRIVDDSDKPSEDDFCSFAEVKTEVD